MEDWIVQASNNFTTIIPTNQIREGYPSLYWGRNGLGDRWAKKKFNYSSVLANDINCYSENLSDEIPKDLLNAFLENNTGNGILGIFVHSRKDCIISRPIRNDIKKQISKLNCVVCGTNTTVCDHKNDLYNDPMVLDKKTQSIDDFQPLCNHCNLQKRQVCIRENENGKLYSAKNIKRYNIHNFEFPWEKKIYDKSDKHCKIGTFWYDPVQFDENLFCYISYTLPIVNEIKYRERITLKLLLKFPQPCHNIQEIIHTP